MRLPDGVTTGRITASLAQFGNSPETLGAKVYVTPSTRKMTWDGGETAVFTTYECPVLEGKLYPPGTTETEGVTPGFEVVASTQPAAGPPLITYNVIVRVLGKPSFQLVAENVTVPADGSVDIGPLLDGLQLPPGTVVVVDSADRELAELAAQDAVSAAGVAAEQAGIAVDARDIAQQLALGASDVTTWTGSDGNQRAVLIIHDGLPYIMLDEGEIEW